MGWHNHLDSHGNITRVWLIDSNGLAEMQQTQKHPRYKQLRIYRCLVFSRFNMIQSSNANTHNLKRKHTTKSTNQKRIISLTIHGWPSLHDLQKRIHCCSNFHFRRRRYHGRNFHFRRRFGLCSGHVDVQNFHLSRAANDVANEVELLICWHLTALAQNLGKIATL